jgi:O-antigen biosynthesis protein
MSERVYVDGKFFAVGGTRFAFRGVTYGTFRPRDGDGARFPEPARIRADVAAMAASGFTVLRTYTAPPEDLLEAAAGCGLRVVAGVFYPDWRYLLGSSRRQRQRMESDARREVRDVARRLAGDERVLALSLGNEVPADVVRWFGAASVGRAIDSLADVVHETDDGRLATYANYPTAEYLPLQNLDFFTFNVFLEDQQDFRRYLTRLQTLAGDRPLVLGELGLHAGTTPEEEKLQAEVLDWQLATAVERGVAGTSVFSWTDEWFVGDAPVEGWHFGLTTADREPRPALEVAAAWNSRDVRDVRVDWPSMSVVVCAYNAAATLDECLRHTCALQYPALEVLGVDDGSTDGTAQIAARHPLARLIQIEHAGLSTARNVGYAEASGDVVAYLDSDAYPSPEWPWYLALAFDRPRVGGVGGPNVPPPDDPPSAQAVARSPGGPVHVLLTDDRAEHVPGCNMAFWRTEVLGDLGGFDPIFTSAGDDVDLCWRVLDRGWDIGFHPAALVWHHRRPGVRPYLRQQRGYGRSEALVETRHPDRFTPLGTARWHGRIYDSFAPSLLRQRVYRGAFGSAPYQSVHHRAGYALDLAHQIGVPTAAAAAVTAPLALAHPLLGLPAVAALAFLLVLAVVDLVRVRPPRGLGHPLTFRATVALLHLAQPLVRTLGRARHRTEATRSSADAPTLPAPLQRLDGGTLLLPADRPRPQLAAAMVTLLRRSRHRVQPGTGWEDYDARMPASVLLCADLLTSEHPEGSVQVRLRAVPRHARLAATALAVVVLAGVLPAAAGAALALALVDVALGLIRRRQALHSLAAAAVAA